MSESTTTKKPGRAKGTVLSPETVARMSKAMKGIPKTAEHKAKLSAAFKGKPSNFAGHKHSPETIAKMSMNHKRPRTYICDICKSKITK